MQMILSFPRLQSYLLEVKAGMLSDECRESGADGFGEEFAEDAELLGHPGRVLKGQLFDADFVFEEIDVLAELGYGVSRRGLLKGDAADFVVYESGDAFDLEHVTVVHSQLFYVFVALLVVPQGGSRVLLQLVEKRRFELMSHEEQLVSGFVQQFAIRFDSSSLRVVIVLGHLVKGIF